MHLTNEQEGKPYPRISFSKEKVGQYNVGATGITGTSSKVTNPSGKVNFEDGAYNATELLFENIDKLGAAINSKSSDNIQNSTVIPQNVKQALIYDDMEDNWDESEEEMANNFERHFSQKASVSSPLPLVNHEYIKGQVFDNFCRLCGKKYGGNDKFCGRCGSVRCLEASE